jgi:hypothetical protein
MKEEKEKITEWLAIMVFLPIFLPILIARKFTRDDIKDLLRY